VLPQFSDLIENLVVTTDRFMTGLWARTTSAPARSSSQGPKSRLAPVPLLWSVALRVHQEIFIQVSIEYVDYLLNFISLSYILVSESGEAASITTCPIQASFDTTFSLRILEWSSLDFADQTLKDCVNVIHTDIIEIWNLKDRAKVGSLLSFFCF
jgi:hypothetical protein